MRVTSSKSENLLMKLRRTFGKKQQNKDDEPRIKNVTFCENCPCVIWGFWSNVV